VSNALGKMRAHIQAPVVEALHLLHGVMLQKLAAPLTERVPSKTMKELLFKAHHVAFISPQR
jgi:hypothetical protein